MTSRRIKGSPDQQTLFAEDFPAKTSALPAKKQASKKALGLVSFTSSCESFAMFDRDTLSWKTLQPSLITQCLEPFLANWPRQGTMRNGLAYQQVLWEPVIREIAGGALPIGPDGTPGLPSPAACVASDGGRSETWLARRERVKLTANNGNGMGMPLTIAAQLLPTPRTCSAMAAPVNSAGNLEGDRFPNLETVMGRMLPTPTTRDWKDGSQQACANVESNGLLGREIHVVSASPQTGDPMYLNPSFVEEMMGYPVGWTA